MKGDSDGGRRSRITTFYSYKGGTGRTMLLANAAWLLAESGRRVLVVDWDFEAPGLHRYFAPFLTDPQLRHSDGLIDLVVAYATAAVDPSTPRADDWFVEYADVLPYAVGVNWRFASGGSITLLPAGRQGPLYAARINTFNWKHFYEKLGGWGFLEHVRTRMRGSFDEILIDSRTGVSDTAGICTVQLPDQLVVCFTLNNQSIEGAAAVAASAIAQRADGELKAFPVTTRIEQSESDKLRNRWQIAQQRFDPLLGHLPAARRESYWQTIQVPYFPLYAYEELLAVVGNQPGDPRSTNLLACVQDIVQEVFNVQPAPPAIDETQRAALLKAFADGSTVQPPAAQPTTAEIASEVKRRAEHAVLQRQDEREAGSSGTGFGGRPLAFVALPFGLKPGPDGYPIDFDRVYVELFRPALEEAGFAVFRADSEDVPGDIRIDAFQELLIADLVVVDLTTDTPNLWYQLGARHALRSRGVILTQGPRQARPFDIYTDRKFHYQIRDGVPDVQGLLAARMALTEMAREVWATSGGRRPSSPLFALLPQLQEPEWHRLLVNDGATAFGEACSAWRALVGRAVAHRRAGDLLVLAEETPTLGLRVEGRRAAGACLMRLQQHGPAVAQFDAALAIDPADRASRLWRISCLARMGRLDEARAAATRLTEDDPSDAESWAIAGRLEKDAWAALWRLPDLDPDQWREHATLELPSVADAQAHYLRAFVADPSHYYSGLHALTLQYLHRHLADGDGDPVPVPVQLSGGVRWACQAALRRAPSDLWARAAWLELCVLEDPPDVVERECRRLLASSQGDPIVLDGLQNQFRLLRDLGFRPEVTEMVLDRIDGALARSAARLAPPVVPRQVLLFLGHVTDVPGREPSQFPASMEQAAARAIDERLDRLGAGPEDLAYSTGAAGGPLLFAEACQRRGVPVRLLQPMPGPMFTEALVMRAAAADPSLYERYQALLSRLVEPPRDMVADLGPAPPDIHPLERCSQWLVHTALAHGPQRVQLICLWNGQRSGARGGFDWAMAQVTEAGGRPHWIDTRTLET